MTEIKISLQGIHGAAKEFSTSSQKMIAMANQLDKTVEELISSWPDLDGQNFHDYFKYWNEQVIGLAQILNTISAELNALEVHLKEAND